MLANNEQRIQEMTKRLTAVLKPTHLQITDESHRHVGHPGAATGMGHFAVEISAQCFAAKSLIERHRMIYDALGDLMETDIHALKIKCV